MKSNECKEVTIPWDSIDNEGKKEIINSQTYGLKLTIELELKTWAVFDTVRPDIVLGYAAEKAYCRIAKVSDQDAIVHLLNEKL